MTAGLTAALAEEAFTPVIGRAYNIRVKAVGDLITANAAGKQLVSTYSQGNTATLHGLYFNTAGQMLDYWAGRAL